MKNRRRAASVVLIVCMILALAGCGKKGDPDKFAGSWAYIHDSETEIVNFDGYGEARYKGSTWKYTFDDNFITMTPSEGDPVKHHYYMDDSEFRFFETTVYGYTGEGTPDGIVGLWKDDTTKWEFEFTAKGTFMEDGYFPGQYILDEENGSVKLVYNDMFPDAIVYYSVSGNQLTLDYPWNMVKCSAKK